jgi:hypothetical protein
LSGKIAAMAFTSALWISLRGNIQNDLVGFERMALNLKTFIDDVHPHCFKLLDLLGRAGVGCLLSQ